MINLIKKGDNEKLRTKLIRKYEKMAYFLAIKYQNAYKLITKEDLVMLALMELDKCIFTYSINKNASFSTYVYIAMKNKILNIIRYFNTQKRNMGNYIYFENQIGNTTLSYTDVLQDEKVDVYANITTEMMHKFIKECLNLEEQEIYLLSLEGNSTKEIATYLNLPIQKVRNKLTYCRRKIKKNEKKYKTMVK